MKTIRYILSAVLVLGSLCSCQDNWDSHYGQEKQQINNENINIVDMSAFEYVKSTPALSSMYKLLEETGVVEGAEKKKGQLFTLLVVDNEGIANNTTVPTDDKKYLAGTHISDIAISPSNLTDGQRILMWNGKYIEVTKVVNEADNSSMLYFNGSKVTKISKVTDGYVYELEGYVHAPKSMYEVISTLDDNYSIFRDMIMSRNQKIFDRKNSISIGVDNTGSTVYDSIFVITNPYFNAKNFDIMSESLTATMLIPSNEIINNALTEAHQKLESWDMTRNDTILQNWIFQAAFFNKNFKPSDFDQPQDLTSIFGKQWRTNVQEVDLSRPLTMSNGTAYYVKKLKIPQNVLIYRIKNFMNLYEFLTDTEKQTYFVTQNLTFNKLETQVTAWSGWPEAGFPYIINRVLIYNLTDKSDATPSNEYKLDFTAFEYKDVDGVSQAVAYKIPPGEYYFFLGFKQNLGHEMDISVNGTFLKTITTSQFTATTFHYDRSGDGFPEGYDVSKATNSKKSNYDCDGGRLGVITIPGTEPVELKITFRGYRAPTASAAITSTTFHHWCLRPTNNCY